MAEMVNFGAVRGAGRSPALPPPYPLPCAGEDREGGCRRSRFHGMSKADRALARSNAEKIRRELDEHRIETGEADEIAGR
jgi:hypothetical protein